VWAMSRVCQKWCTGLTLPENLAANSSSSRLTWLRTTQ
jgi:hypothetical protein